MTNINNILFSGKTIERSVVLALNELAATKSFDEITVDEICKAANISRSTYYRAFNNKEDAQKYGMHTVSAIGFGQIGRALTWCEGFTLTLLGTKQLANSFRAVRASADSRSAFNLSADFVSYHMEIFAETITKYKRERFSEGLEYILRAWLYSLCECLNDWRNSNYALPVDTMANYLERTVPPELHELLKYPAKPKG